MKFSSVLLFAVAASVQAQKGVQRKAREPVANEYTMQGCFSAKSSDWKKTSFKNGLSFGSCNDACKAEDKEVSATSVEDCWCGSMYPPEDTLTDDSKCNEPCPGFGDEACGGFKGSSEWFSVANTGKTIRVLNDEPESSSSSTSASSAASSPTGTDSSDSNEPSASSAPAEDDNKDNEDEDSGSSGANVGGIVGGVVAGVAAFAIVGGIIFWLFRRRRNSEIEEEHRRNMAVNSFIAGAKPPSSSGGLSMTDSRMDPGLAQRRMSDGSIADNQDYSRKILRVTNA